MRQALSAITLCGAITWMFGLTTNAARAQTAASFPVISPVEQTARDTDRMRILQEELAREQHNAIEAAKRRAERLVAKDQRGTEEAEELQTRAAANIASLQREIDATTKQIAKTKSKTIATSAPPGTTLKTSIAAPSMLNGRTVPWWDVYGKAPARDKTIGAPQPVSTPLDHHGMK